MFKGIQGKLVVIFILIILAVMMVFGTVMQSMITGFYHENFVSQMHVAFSELTSMLESASARDDNVSAMTAELKTYSGRLGLNTNRNFYILDANCTVLASDAENSIGSPIDMTDNIIAAVAGRLGDSTKVEYKYLDYAVPVGNYLIYVRDNKNDQLSVNQAIFFITFQALIGGILISIVIGFLMARTITKPIENLTKRAEQLAQGSFDSYLDARANDELGKLAKTFNDMATVITESMDEISQEKNKVETIIHYMTDGVIAFGLEGESIHINPAAHRMLAIEYNTVIDFDTFFTEYKAEITFADLIYLEHSSTIKRSMSANNRDFSVYFAAFKVENEKTAGVVVVFQDITESLQIDNMRREFVANVSHELRTPLTTIKGYSETMLDSDMGVNEDSKYFLNVICREVDRMTRIVKDLLTLSRLDHEALERTKSVFPLEDFLREIVAKLSIDAKNNEHTLTFMASTQLPEVWADRDRLEQVVTNIISNSIKYTPKGGTIEVFSGKVFEDIYIKINDNGIGIPENDLPRIFERFYRVDKARTREYGGTGLGLAIAKEIIELHDGTINIESRPGEGTSVLIKLPV